MEHKVSSKYHRAGESQRIIVDQVELGRDPRCQVRFDERFSTVSRRHAAIVRDGDNWKLIQLSKTNSTYLNGRKVADEWYLQNGDEIQLSTNGPKLGFITPAGDKGLVKSIGLTARLNLFSKQALRPYRTALSILVAILVVGCCVGGYFINDLNKKNKSQTALIAENEKRYNDAIAVQDSLLAMAATEREGLADEVSKLKGQLGKISSRQRDIAVATGGIDNVAIDVCLPNVFFIYSTYLDVTFPDGEEGTLECGDGNVPSWTGTGFLLEDGTFVTARHIVEPWNYWVTGGEVEEDYLELNVIVNNGGNVNANFIAISSSGKRYKFSSNQFHIDKSNDRREVVGGFRVSIAGGDAFDVATFKTGQLEGLKFDKERSRSLGRGTKLMILGFPLGYGANSPSSINPISSTATVGVDGLDRGVILTSETNFELGCSGGPAFIMDKDGNYTVIGVVSAIEGRNTGFIVPISNIR
ncbi:MAG: FHA domain-containing protein [Bacteroidales bacterium]|nr:FHA domain-containing protein [Bacteroidales bacterium]